MATKLVLMLRRRSTIVLGLTVLAAVVGSVHNVHPGGLGFWDGPL